MRIVVRSMYRRIKRIVDYANALSQYSRFHKKNDHRFDLKWKNRWIITGENSKETYFDRHYIYHTAWAARILEKSRPNSHVDVSSSLYFVSLVSAFVPITFVDFRPPVLKLTNLDVTQGDITNLPYGDKSVESISCMHVIEHIGLGRYGDSIDPGGDVKAADELTRVVSSGGQLLFVVPVGTPLLVFNAHRVYSYRQVIDLFPQFELREFSLITDIDTGGRVGMLHNASEEISNAQHYGCGCFWFSKK